MTKQKLYEASGELPPEAKTAARDWHARMAVEYVETKAQPFKLLRRWLRGAGIDDDDMEKYGLFVFKAHRYRNPQATGDAYRQWLDHSRVIKRRGDNALFVLSEPYNEVEELQASEWLANWRALGAEILVSNDSGWFPGRTIMALTSQPPQVIKNKKGEYEETKTDS